MDVVEQGEGDERKKAKQKDIPPSLPLLPPLPPSTTPPAGISGKKKRRRAKGCNPKSRAQKDASKNLREKGGDGK